MKGKLIDSSIRISTLQIFEGNPPIVGKEVSVVINFDKDSSISIVGDTVKAMRMVLKYFMKYNDKSLRLQKAAEDAFKKVNGLSGTQKQIDGFNAALKKYYKIQSEY